MLLELQNRLQESTDLMKAAEGYSPEVRMLVQVSEARTQIKGLQEFDKDLTKQLVDHIKETGEVVATETQRASLEQATTVSYDETKLKEILGNRFNDCLEFSFSKSRLEALIMLGEVSADEVAPAKQEKVTDRLTIRAVKK